ncbi:MAG: hypothetical protein RBR97_07050, partial [Bacteroidales bacterium]|nr:hypothetical protein [Bacteroidales bacterium]
MIQNILTFCVKNDLTFVEGSIPSGKLVANDINRNSIYLVTPYDEAIVKANFQTNLQSDTPTSVLGILVNGKITIDEIVPPSKSYYNLVKDWNIYEFKVPSTTLSFISRNRTGKIGINFSIEQRLVPTIKDSYGEYQGEILSQVQPLLESGYYINKTIGFDLDTGTVIAYDLNDILVLTIQESPLDDIQVKISAYSNRGSTPTTLYSVDPSLLNDNFETIEPSLTAQIVQQVNDNTGDIVLLFQNIGINNATLVDFENRISVNEQDIDTAEGNIINLQGRMATAESDIEDIEDGTTIVEKALRDSLGNIIKNHYVASVIPTYDDNTNNFYLNPYNGDESLMPTRVEGVTLPKATTLKDGLLAKEDKTKINAIASDIASAISTHDGSETSHLYIRTLINNLQKEVDRLNAKGRSWGEVDKTFSELWAMAEPTRSDYINTFLATAFSGYTPSNGDLVYTIVSNNEEVHELEYNSTLSQWVDNGAYIVGKASNTQMGIVMGDLTYVSILNGIIQVLKSDYATNVGSSGASYDYDDLLALFTEVANDIYKKNETYSATQIEQRITDLLGLANLQDTAIEKSAGVFTFDNGDSILASLLAQYNWVITRFYNVDGGVQNVRYNLFKPSEAVIDNRTIVQIDRSPVRYAEIKRDNGNILFRIVDESDTFDSGYVCTMKMWGVKLDGINANEVDYDNSTSGLVADKVQGAIDEVENHNYTTILPNSYSRTSFYTQYTTGNQIPSGSYFVQEIITNPKFTKILTYAVAGNTTPAVIAFYNDELTYDSSTYMSAYSVQFSIPDNTPKTYFSFIPFGCKAVVITSRNDLGGIDAPYTKCSDDYIADKISYSNGDSEDLKLIAVSSSANTLVFKETAKVDELIKVVVDSFNFSNPTFLSFLPKTTGTENRIIINGVGDYYFQAGYEVDRTYCGDTNSNISYKVYRVQNLYSYSQKQRFIKDDFRKNDSLQTIDFLEIKNLVRGINANDINLNGSINNSLNRVCNSTFLPYSNGFIEVVLNDMDGLWRYSVSNIRKKSKTTFVESFNSGWKTGNYSQYVYDGDEI